MAVLRPFFSFYGGKWRSARHYPAPTYDRLVEPFAGSAGYALRYAERDVHLNEIDPAIANLWAYLIGATKRDIMRLPLVESVDELPARVPEEARTLVGFWLNKASVAPRRTRSRWAHEYPDQFWGERVRARIANSVSRISHWTISNTSYEQLPDWEASWFIDPPYNNPAGALYTHSDIDYGALAGWCRTRRGQVMVCEQVGADWLPFEPFRVSRATAGSRGKGTSHEALWVGDSEPDSLLA